MLPIVLYRKSLTEPEELTAIQRHFDTATSMVGIKDRLVIGRYSCVPFYDEVVEGLTLNGSRLINSLSEHQYIANFDYYHDIAHLTPKTYFRLQDVPDSGGPYVVKGITNSKKHQWNSLMFAQNKAEAINIACELGTDMYLGQQPAIVRDYVPLERLGEGLNGLPFSNEWRCFFYKNQLLCCGFYWTELEDKPTRIAVDALVVAQQAAYILSKHTNYFVVDVARTAAGSHIIVEINDAQMSGLSECNANSLYYTLKRTLDGNAPTYG